MSPGEYKYVENPDGTFTEYYRGAVGGPERIVQGDTYSSEAMAESDRLFGQIAVDSGTSGQDGSIFVGADGRNIYAAERVVEDFRTGQPWKTLGEQEVGDELIAEGESLGSLPVFTSVASAASGAVLGVGAAALGITIGTGIDELLGLPTLQEHIFGGSSNESSSGFGYESPFFHFFEWGPEVRLTKMKLCTELGFPNLGLTISGEHCAHGEERYAEHTEYKSGGKWHLETESSIISVWSGSGSASLGCPSSWLFCEAYGEAHYLYYLQGQLKHDAYPDSGLKSLEKSVVAPTKPEVPAQEPLTSPHVIPTTVPAPARHVIIEKAKDKEGNPVVVPLETPGPEEKEIPGPLPAEIPPWELHELGTHYQSRIESDGFTDVEVKELPNSATDFSLGPDEVVGVDPAVGTKTATSTKVVVSENPADAPPATPGPVVPGVTPPGLKIPDFGVLCTKFPFGVPCWLVEEFARWSTTSVVPKWNIPLEVPLLGWRTEFKLDLTFLEPAMEIVRPLLALMATIGLVVMFFHFALGGTGAPPGGDADE
ncbi:MAG TPA: hypothetical protein VG053_00760 [Solirubrobacteraceae bacterium]|jgi:hypothetical protein|nr:hypothetical protein [Solirubrobacteraceae bacterium]